MKMILVNFPREFYHRVIINSTQKFGVQISPSHLRPATCANKRSWPKSKGGKWLGVDRLNLRAPGERSAHAERALLPLKGNIDVQIISSQLPAARGATRKLHYSRASVFRYIGRVCMRRRRRRRRRATALLGPRSTAGRHFRTAPAARRSWCLVGSAGSPDYHRSSLWCRCARCLRAVLELSEKKSQIHPVRHHHQSIFRISIYYKSSMRISRVASFKVMEASKYFARRHGLAENRALVSGKKSLRNTLVMNRLSCVVLLMRGLQSEMCF
jgi:hypothetical protein